jgi:hypothetical protein
VLQEISISAYVIAIAGAVVVTAFSLPALTEGGQTAMSGVSQADYEAAQEQEMDYCKAATQSLNCACFAHTSGMILAYKSDQIRSSNYADRRDLARAQAKSRC